jgi:SAM-dependent methyltransferase
MPNLAALPRSTDAEWLDGGTLRDDELRANLLEMARLNRLPGGVATSVRAVGRLMDGDAGPVLDVGTGAGDFARHLRRRRPAPILLADVDPRVLDVARRTTAGMREVRYLEAEATDLPLADGSVTVAHASLLLHHLDPPDAVAALREMRRVARRGVVVNDLRRSRLALVMTAVPVMAMGRSPVTRHDGVLSARRAYTLHELDDLAAGAGLRPVRRSPSWWPRVTTTYA